MTTIATASESCAPVREHGAGPDGEANGRIERTTIRAICAVMGRRKWGASPSQGERTQCRPPSPHSSVLRGCWMSTDQEAVAKFAWESAESLSCRRSVVQGPDILSAPCSFQLRIAFRLHLTKQKQQSGDSKTVRQCQWLQRTRDRHFAANSDQLPGGGRSPGREPSTRSSHTLCGQ